VSLVHTASDKRAKIEKEVEKKKPPGWASAGGRDGRNCWQSADVSARPAINIIIVVMAVRAVQG